MDDLRIRVAQPSPVLSVTDPKQRGSRTDPNAQSRRGRAAAEPGPGRTPDRGSLAPAGKGIRWWPEPDRQGWERDQG